MNEPWIQTVDAQAFYPLAPKAEAINTAALTWALANIARFSGHTTSPYSVATHCLHVWAHLAINKAPVEVQIAGLLHDAHEALSGFGDVAAPVKKLCPLIGEIERKIDIAVAERYKFNSEFFYHPLVKEADLRMLATEKRDLLLPSPLEWGELPEPYKQNVKRTNLVPEDAMRFMGILLAVIDTGKYEEFASDALDRAQDIVEGC